MFSIKGTNAIWEVPPFQKLRHYSSPLILGWRWHACPHHPHIDGVTGVLDGVGDRAYAQAVAESKACNGISCGYIPVKEKKIVGEHLFDNLLISPFTVGDCKARWKGLRDSFVKSRKKMHLPSGSGATSHRDWKYATLMPVMPSRRSVPLLESSL